MPICIPNDLPAVTTLENENIFVMKEDRATTRTSGLCRFSS